MNTEIDRKIAVILVADVVGYSKHMERDENATLKAYAECEKILKQFLSMRNGSIFNTAGDSVLIEFTSAVNAVGFAVDFQTKMIERNKSGSVLTMLEFRIGINMGDVVSRKGNLLGDGVNIAANMGAPVIVSANGTVAFVGDNIKNFGKLVLVKHDGGIITAYAHLDNISVNEGDVLADGDTIGNVGSTGRVSSPQLHFEIRKSRQPIDPRSLIS